jgi:ATP-binding cassette subfamily B protein
MKKLILFMSKYFKGLYVFVILFILFSLSNSYIQLNIPIVSQVAIDKWIATTPESSELISLGIKIGILVGCTILLGIFNRYIGTYLSSTVSLKVRKDMIHHIQNLPLNELENKRTGDLITRAVSDVENISEIIYKVPESTLNALLLLAGSIYTMYRIDIELTMLLIIVIPVFVLINVYLAPKARRLQRKSRTAYGDMISSAEGIISGIRVSKSFNNQEYLDESFNETGKKYKKIELKEAIIESLFRSSEILMRESFRLITILVGGYKVATGDITIGELILFQALMFAFLRPIQVLLELLPDILKSLGSFDKLTEVMNIHQENLNGQVLTNLKGDISIKNLSFSYKSNAKSKVLDNLTLDINAGEKIGIVGHTGCGKSTFCNLLVKFYQANSNSIFIDGIDINDLSSSFIRSEIGIVQQDVHIFASTIKENLLVAKPNATDEELNNALIFAEAKDFIDKLPNGINTFAGERGVKLSGGQKQRISIARIFLQDPKILILDESTSSLDNETEKKIQKTFDKLHNNRTIISVAHRLTSIENSDKIIVFDNGKISEIGTHIELLNNDGIYKKLYFGTL